MSGDAIALNDTHDTALRSWVPSANTGTTDFPIQNLPYGVFRRAGTGEPFRIGVAIGEQIVDLPAAAAALPEAFAAVPAATRQALRSDSLNDLMAQGAAAWTALRLAVSRLLRAGAPSGAGMALPTDLLAGLLIAQRDADYALPARIGNYTDFYSSIHHATAVGRLFRPDAPLLPNYQWVPVGYHGRASSIGVSGQQVRRPLGQTCPPGSSAPVFGPCKRLDYEMEVGIFIGQGNALGDAIAVDRAEQAVFGLCLLNDWSARDQQAWESQPLGPFLSKNFASTISPWVVTLEALAPYRSPWRHDPTDPQPLPYLDAPRLRDSGAFDVQLEVLLQTSAMRQQGQGPVRLSLSNFRHAYWTVAQLVAHHTVGGCNLQAGDLLGSGTQSGPHESEAGSLLELTRGNKVSITLPNGEQRGFLEDGDRVVMRGWCERTGRPRIGFGEVAGMVLPARAQGEA